jgi:hypothetical protein
MHQSILTRYTYNVIQSKAILSSLSPPPQNRGTRSLFITPTTPHLHPHPPAPLPPPSYPRYAPSCISGWPTRANHMAGGAWQRVELSDRWVARGTGGTREGQIELGQWAALDDGRPEDWAGNDLGEWGRATAGIAPFPSCSGGRKMGMWDRSCWRQPKKLPMEEECLSC